MASYSLFWREEDGVYELRDDDRTLGTISDDPKFSQLVLAAFLDQDALLRMRDSMRAMRLYSEEIAKLSKELT